MSTGKSDHCKNLKTRVQSPECWCIPKDMEGVDYLVVEPACEVNEKGTSGKKVGNKTARLSDHEDQSEVER